MCFWIDCDYDVAFIRCFIPSFFLSCLFLLTMRFASRVKVASGKLVFHYHTKVANGPKCGDCGRKLAGIQHLRPKEYRAVSKRQKVVSRAYGGNKCHTCVRDRVVRAFLIEERKIVKNVLKAKAHLAAKTAAKAAEK